MFSASVHLLMDTWFHVLATLGDVSVNTAVQRYLEHTAFISLDVCPIMGLSDHIESILLLFEGLLEHFGYSTPTEI